MPDWTVPDLQEELERFRPKDEGTPVRVCVEVTEFDGNKKSYRVTGVFFRGTYALIQCDVQKAIWELGEEIKESENVS